MRPIQPTLTLLAIVLAVFSWVALHGAARAQPPAAERLYELDYLTYFGGARIEAARRVLVDSDGGLYLAGSTGSANLPTTPNAYAPDASGSGDGYVAKLDPSGSTLVFSTYLGGSEADGVWDLSVDAAGNVYVVGFTYSADFPVTPGAYDESYNGGGDVFVAKLDPTGQFLLYSTFLGGDQLDGGSYFPFDGGIDVNRVGEATVTGVTRSFDFPVTSTAYDSAYAAHPAHPTIVTDDAFITTLDADGASLLYSTYLGTPFYDRMIDVAVDEQGMIHVAGTGGYGFPVTPGAFDTSYNHGHYDAVAVKLDPRISGYGALVYSTYFGGDGGDSVGAIHLDADGKLTFVGGTGSTNLPTTPGAFQSSPSGGGDGYVAQLDASGANLTLGTYFGASAQDRLFGMAVDSAGIVYLTGMTASADFPVTPGALDPTFGGGFNAYLAAVDSGGSLVLSTFLGPGSRFTTGLTLAADRRGRVYFGGLASDPDWPTTPSAFDPTFNGVYDAVVGRLGVQCGSFSLPGLIQHVGGVGLPHGLERSLLAELEAAQRSIDDSRAVTACAQLAAFRHHVDAQRGKKISEPDAECMIEAATAICLRL